MIAVAVRLEGDTGKVTDLVEQQRFAAAVRHHFDRWKNVAIGPILPRDATI